MDWRVAKSLLKLREQVNAKFPGRSTASDGTIGDASHATRDSDHNPWIKDVHGQPVVTALDITHDPAHGFDSYAFAEELRQARDPRVKYIISNRRISNPSIQDGAWRHYSGSNPHDKHVHVSVKGLDKFFDNQAPWRVPMLGDTVIDHTPVSPLPEPAVPTLAQVQAEVNHAGFGPITVDGKLGPQTLKALMHALKTVEPLERRV